MNTDPQPSLLRSDLTVIGVCLFFAVAAFVFRDNLGLVGAVVIGVAAIVQLIRIILLRGSWSKFKSLFKEFLNALSGL